MNLRFGTERSEINYADPADWEKWDQWFADREATKTGVKLAESSGEQQERVRQPQNRLKVKETHVII